MRPWVAGDLRELTWGAGVAPGGRRGDRIPDPSSFGKGEAGGRSHRSERDPLRTSEENPGRKFSQMKNSGNGDNSPIKERDGNGGVDLMFFQFECSSVPGVSRSFHERFRASASPTPVAEAHFGPRNKISVLLVNNIKN